MDGRQSLEAGRLTLGILAGGKATRLGGADKAWLSRGGVPQVLRIAERFGRRAGAVLVSANVDEARYLDAGLKTVSDRSPGIGPLAGLDALAAACMTPWMLTLPVDIVDANDCLVDSLAAAGDAGASVEDDDGRQPLVALWNVTRLQSGAAKAIASGDYSVQGLQSAMGMKTVRLGGVRLGNLNTPSDLEAAGVDLV